MNFSQDTISYLKNLKLSFYNKQQPQNVVYSTDFEQKQKPVRGVILSQSATFISNKISGLDRIKHKKNKIGKFFKNKIDFIRSLSIERRSNKETDKLRYVDKVFQIFNPDVLSELNDIINSPNIETLKSILPYLLIDNNKKTSCIDKLKILKYLQNENAIIKSKKDGNSTKNVKDSKLDKGCSFKIKEIYLSQDKQKYKAKKNFSDDSLNLNKQSNQFEAGDSLNKMKKSDKNETLKESAEPTPDYFSLHSKSSFLNEVNKSGDFATKIDKRSSTLDDVRYQLDNLKLDIPSNEDNNKKKTEKKSFNFETPICKLNHFENSKSFTENKNGSFKKIKSKKQLYTQVQNSIGENIFNCYKNTSDDSKTAFKGEISQHYFYDSQIDQSSLSYNQNDSTKSQSTISTVENILAFKELKDFNSQNKVENEKRNNFLVQKSNTRIYESAHSTGTFHSAKTNSEKEENSTSRKHKTECTQKSKSREPINKRSFDEKPQNERHSEFFNKIPFCLDLAKSSEDRFTNCNNKGEKSNDFTKQLLFDEKTNFSAINFENETLEGLKSSVNSSFQSFSLHKKNSRELIPKSFSEKLLTSKTKILNKDEQTIKPKNPNYYIYDTESSVVSLSSDTSVMNTMKEVINNDCFLNKQEYKMNSLLKPCSDDYSVSSLKNDQMISTNNDNYFCSNIWKNVNSNIKKFVPTKSMNFDLNQPYNGNDENLNLNLFYEQRISSNQFLGKNLNIAHNEIEIIDNYPIEDLVEKNNFCENETPARFRNSLSFLDCEEELNIVNDNLLNCNNNNGNDKNYCQNEIFNGENFLKYESNEINLALQEIDAEYKANLFSKNRPSEIELMSNEELIQEKTILEKILFQLEWNFGWNTILHENENFLVLKKKYDLVRTILEGLKCKSCGLRYYPFNR